MTLPEGYAGRAPGPNDLEAIVGLIAAFEIAHEGTAEVSLDDVRSTWQRARFDMENDAWAVEARDGVIVGYADVWPREDYAHIEGDGYVHPDHRARGIGRWLVQAMERRAAELAVKADAGTNVLLRSTVIAADGDACELFESEGFRPGRHFWRMAIDLREGVPEPEWPEGVSVRAFRPGDEEEVHTLVQEAFSDNYRHVRTAFEDWRDVMMARESFDPALWFLAESGARIIGVALCPDYPDRGWVRQLAVARDWRRRGVGAALLRHAFRELARHGKPNAGLALDSFNLSGAHEFYVANGMHAEREYQEYELEIGG